MIRCTCGNQLTSADAACERCLPGFGGNATPPLRMRHALQDDYSAKVARLEEELLGWKEAADLAGSENVQLRNARDALYATVRVHNTTIEAAEAKLEEAVAEVTRLRALLNAAEKDCHKARFALQTIGESTVPDQPASSGLSELEHVQHHHAQLRRLAIMTLRPEAIGIYEAPRREADEIRVRGVGRDLFEPRSVRVALTERPTDAEIKSIHDWMRGWRL